MAKTDFKSVDQYIATHPPAVQAVLEQVRGAIRKVLPEAAEVISYQIPAFKQWGGAVVYFAGWKQHYSLYPVGETVAAVLGDRLAGHEMSKGTIRFPLDAPVPTALIEDIVRLLAEQAAERAAAKPTKARKRGS